MLDKRILLRIMLVVGQRQNSKMSKKEKLVGGKCVKKHQEFEVFRMKMKKNFWQRISKNKFDSRTKPKKKNGKNFEVTNLKIEKRSNRNSLQF